MATAPEQRTVLVVGDDPEVREVMAEHLTLHGFAVLEALSGLDALLQVKHVRPEAVVLDLNMPRLGGLDALKRIRAFDPSTTMIALAEAADTEVHWRALELGAHDVLPKPVVLEDLLASLEDVESSETASAEPAPTDELAGPSPAPAAPHGRILIADEDPDLRAALEEFLTESGYQAIAVADDTRALEAIAQASPDVVLLDISMAGLAGIEALSAIRALAPRAAVIMVSAVADIEIARRALARGAFDYAVKPVDLAYLRESIEAALMMKQLEV